MLSSGSRKNNLGTLLRPFPGVARTWLVTMTGMRKVSAMRFSAAACWPAGPARQHQQLPVEGLHHSLHATAVDLTQHTNDSSQLQSLFTKRVQQHSDKPSAHEVPKSI